MRRSMLAALPDLPPHPALCVGDALTATLCVGDAMAVRHALVTP